MIPMDQEQLGLLAERLGALGVRRREFLHAGYIDRCQLADEFDLRRTTGRKYKVADLWVNREHSMQDVVKRFYVLRNRRIIVCLRRRGNWPSEYAGERGFRWRPNGQPRKRPIGASALRWTRESATASRASAARASWFRSSWTTSGRVRRARRSCASTRP